MSSPFAQNRILANNANLVRGAVITASAQRASTDIRLTAQSRKGRGRMVLSGPFTGAEDTAVEVEITADSGALRRATAPVVRGVGNGTLTCTAIDAGAVAETLTFTLADGGDPAAYAELAFYGVSLRAKTAGGAGNTLALTVTRNLLLTDSKYSLLADLKAGTVDLDGQQYDWGAVPAPGSTIPADAPRLAFVGFPQVFRHWKAWSAGKWLYHLDPAPEYDVPANTLIQSVSGDYTLTLTDGAVTEVYAAVTLYDFVSAVQSRSALVDVIGVIAADTAPGGMAVTDIPLRTDAHLLPVEAKIAGRYGATRLDGLALTDPVTAATENVRVVCLGGSPARWTVDGAVSGSLPTATTGARYAAGPVTFTIPEIDLPIEQIADLWAKVELVGRDADEVVPAVCIEPLKRGKQASAKSVTFTYSARPPATCNCKNAPAIRLTGDCLGLDDGGNSMALDPEYQSRLETLYTWRASVFRTQADITLPADAKWAERDMDLCDGAVTAFADALAQVYEVADALTEWDAALTEIQADFAVLAGVGARPSADVAAGMMVGAAGFHPLNLHTYRLNSVVAFSDNPDYTTDDTRADNAKSSLPFLPDLTAGWPLTGGAAVMHLVTGQSYAPSTDQYYDYGYDVSWTDLGLAADLRQSADTEQLVRRYSARMDYVLTLAGIVPKSDASTGGDGCWRDNGDAFWWVESTGRYLPAFTGEAYYSSVRNQDGAAVSTQEFGFGLRVDCAGALKEGDAFTITINGAASGNGYAEGDSYTIPIIGGAPAAFAGGEDGDATQTWAVSGSVGGAYPDWLWDPAAPTAYTAGPVECTLTAGGIPFEVGDAIAFSLEGGQLRWRRDGGAWTTGELYAASHDLGDGLTLSAVPGSAPAFLPGDAWTFLASATYGPGRLRQPREGQAFAWDGASVTLDIDLGSVQPIEALLIALHTLPQGSWITVDGGDADPTTWRCTFAWREGPMLALPAPGATARYLRLICSGGIPAGASIGWLWAGVPWAPTSGASSLQHTRQYGLSRTGGRNPAALYRGRGTGGRWGWSLDADSALLQADVDGLWALLDHVAEQGLEWVCLVPDVRNRAGATLAQIDADEATLTEQLGYTLEGQALFDVDLPFRAVLG